MLLSVVLIVKPFKTKGIMNKHKNDLMYAIYNLVQELLKRGCEHDFITKELSQWGFTKKELEETFGLKGK